MYGEDIDFVLNSGRRTYVPIGLEFRQVLVGGELETILREMPSYTDNPRLDMS